MIAAEFDYRRANTLDEALTLLAQNEEAKILAGGHSLIPAMKLRLAMPPMLIDIGRIADLSYIREDAGQIRLDIFNVGNSSAVTSQNVGVGTTYLYPNGIISPRIARIGFAVNF